MLDKRIKFLASTVTLNPINGVGPLGNYATIGAVKCGSVYILAQVVSKSIGFITVLSFLWFVFQVVIAALSWIGSSGEKQNLQIAREKLMHATIGLGIAVAAIFIANLISALLGIQGLFDLSNVVPSIAPPGFGSC